MLPHQGRVGLASPTSLMLLTETSTCKASMQSQDDLQGMGSVGDDVFDSAGDLWAGGSAGSLWRLPAQEGSSAVLEGSFLHVNETGIVAIAVGGSEGPGRIAVATTIALYHNLPNKKGEPRRWRHDWLLSLFDSSINVLRFNSDASSLWVGGDWAAYHIDMKDSELWGGAPCGLVYVCLVSLLRGGVIFVRNDVFL